MTIKETIKRILPDTVISYYHMVLSLLSAVIFGDPSRKLIVIGVTGTKGKSSLGNMLWQLLTDAGYTVGLTGTVNYRIGAENILSADKMTMPGRTKLQSLMRRMVTNGCTVAIIETTSEGIKQWRHLGIKYDIGVFTNLSEEHIEAHGSFEAYKQAKLTLFRHIELQDPKMLGDAEVKKGSVINMDDPHGKEFLEEGTYEKVRVGSREEDDLRISDIEELISGTNFKLNGNDVTIPLLGAWNASNCALAFGVGTLFGLDIPAMAESARRFEQFPGRMEFINEGQPFYVIVDYAHEPKSLGLLYEFCQKLVEENKRVITLISSTGGGRDVARRAKNGRVAGEMCDYVIVTNEDPYDDDPQEIIDDVAEGVKEAGKVEGQNFWRILVREEAIRKAFELAQPGDVVLLTAKGAEQTMVLANGKTIEWDDRKEARNLLKSMRST